MHLPVQSNPCGRSILTIHDARYLHHKYAGLNVAINRFIFKKSIKNSDLIITHAMYSEEAIKLIRDNNPIAKIITDIDDNLFICNDWNELAKAPSFNFILRKKVADALVILKKKYQVSEAVPFSIDISRENLANIAGTATESLIRTLSDFKSEKLIDIKDGHITIVNEKKLEGMIN